MPCWKLDRKLGKEHNKTKVCGGSIQSTLILIALIQDPGINELGYALEDISMGKLRESPNLFF